MFSRYNLQDVKKVLQSKHTNFAWQRKLVEDVDRNELRSDKAGDIARFGHHLSQAALIRANWQLEAQILRQLDFQDRSDRSDRISKAHQDSFQWIYASSSNLRKSNLEFKSLADWLESDDSLYWITGKPGSGKSTLMKFITTDRRTRQHLQVWSQDRPLVIASFYFWNSGSEIQMNEVGMLRTLLYEALTQWPQRIAELFPRRWATSKFIGADTNPWTVPELRSALNAFVRGCAGVRNLCLFVDGLDECSYEHERLVGLFTPYLHLTGVKCCLASRPWPVFQDAFCKRASLMLQDLTFNDIHRFAKDKLCSSRGFAMLEANEPQYASELVLRIAQKASGVYLWVRLVVDSLITGLSNCDRILDLEKRLEEIPADLEELYEKILRSIEKRYAGHASQFFQLIRESHGTATALTMYFADEEDGSMAIDTNFQPLSDEEKTMKYEIVKKRLTSRCKGFLEIPNDVDMVIDESLALPSCPASPLHSISSWESDYGGQESFDESETYQSFGHISARRFGHPRRKPRSEPYQEPHRSIHRDSPLYPSRPSRMMNSNSERAEGSDESGIYQSSCYMPARRFVHPHRELPRLPQFSRAYQSSRYMPARRFVHPHRELPRLPQFSRRPRPQTASSVDRPSINPVSLPDNSIDISSKDDGRQGETRPRKNVNSADLKVAYLHRTARDFLEKPDIWSSIMADSPEGFHVQKSLLRAFILTLKTSQPNDPITVGNLITQCLQYTATIELRFQSVPLKEMEEIMGASTDLCKRTALQCADHIENEMVIQISKHGEPALLSVAAQYSLQSFIQKNLEDGAVVLPGQPNRPLLDCVVGNYRNFPSLCERTDSKEDRVIDLAFIRRLLDLGHNPNESSSGDTPWERVLLEIRKIASEETSPEKRKRLLLHWAKIIDEFVKHDADPYANKNGPSANSIREAFGHDLPKVARAFEETMSKSQRAWSRLGKFLTKSPKAYQDVTPLFRQIQLENAQLPGLTLSEHFRAPAADRSSGKGGLLDSLKRFESAK